MAGKEYKIIVETHNGEDGDFRTKFQPRTNATNSTAINTIKNVACQVPYGESVSSTIGQVQNGANVIGKLSGGAGAMAIAVAALSLAKKAHELARHYVQDVRQSNEMQRRAGIYRRNND